MTFDLHAQAFVSRGMARKITPEETLDVLNRSEKAGLVPMAFNSINPGGIYAIGVETVAVYSVT